MIVGMTSWIFLMRILAGIGSEAVAGATIAIRIMMNAIVVVGLNLLIGYAGQISLGHAGFLGIGAYASAAVAGYSCLNNSGSPSSAIAEWRQAICARSRPCIA